MSALNRIWTFYWSAPAALLARFLGDALGEALSAKRRKHWPDIHELLFQMVMWHPKQLLSPAAAQHNILMTLRVSWGIQLMSTSLIPPVPFSTFTGSLFFCRGKGVSKNSLSHFILCLCLLQSVLIPIFYIIKKYKKTFESSFKLCENRTADLWHIIPSVTPEPGKFQTASGPQVHPGRCT